MAKPADTYYVVRELIDQAYTKQGIEDFYKAFLKQFILDNETLCRQYPVPVEQVKNGKVTKKGDLADVFAPFFAYGELFRAMRVALPERFTAVLDKILWEGPQEHTTLEKEFKVKVAYTHQEMGKQYIGNAVEELNPLCGVFRDSPQHQSGAWYNITQGKLDDKTSFVHTLFLDPPLRVILKKFTDKPAGYDLLPLDKTGPTAFTFADEALIFSELPIMLAYIQQGKLSVNDYGKAVVGSLNKMRKYCGIREFYEGSTDKNLATLRTRLLAELLLPMVRKELDRYTDPAAFLKKIFEVYRKNPLTNSALLFHLKGLNRVSDETLVTGTLFGLLRELPPLVWVSAENGLKYALYRDLNLRIFQSYDATNYVYLEYDGQYGKYKQTADFAHYQRFIMEPLVRGGFFLFASFGLVDIAYDLPAHPGAVTFNREYLSVFDGLRYIRLTGLGAYVCGLSPHFAAPNTQDQNVLLDEDNLFISYRGDNRSLQSVLEKIGKRAGGNENLYKVDYETLLGDCSTEKEIESKVNLFKQLLSNNPPRLWKDFFATLQRRSYRLNSQEEEYKVFQLPEDKELIRMFASDDFLKKHVVKAEMYYVLIPKGNISKVKSYLKKFGFLVDFRSN